jgi:hypothetical protein
MAMDFTEETEETEETATDAAVKKSLLVDFAKKDDPALAQQWGIPIPFRHADTEIVVQPTS